MFHAAGEHHIIEKVRIHVRAFPAEPYRIGSSDAVAQADEPRTEIQTHIWFTQVGIGNMAERDSRIYNKPGIDVVPCENIGVVMNVNMRTDGEVLVIVVGVIFFCGIGDANAHLVVEFEPFMTQNVQGIIRVQGELASKVPAAAKGCKMETHSEPRVAVQLLPYIPASCLPQDIDFAATHVIVGEVADKTIFRKQDSVLHVCSYLQRARVPGRYLRKCPSRKDKQQSKQYGSEWP